MKRINGLMLAIALAPSFLLTGCSSLDWATAAFYGSEKANLIVLYSSDTTSYVAKPAQKEGDFFSILDREHILKVAQSVKPRDTAVVTLGTFSKPGDEERTIQGWVQSLAGLNYRRVIFLRSSGSTTVDGLAVIREWKNPQPQLTEQTPSAVVSQL